MTSGTRSDTVHSDTVHSGARPSEVVPGPAPRAGGLSARCCTPRLVAVLAGIALLVLHAPAGSIAAQSTQPAPSTGPNQGINLEEAQAEEEFRFGVQAFHSGRFNDAIVAFIRALAFTPENMRMREWLGRAYYHAGLEDAALAEWQIVAEREAAGAYLLSRMDTLQYRRGIMPFQDAPLSLARSQLLDAVRNGVRLFQRPAGVAARADGDLLVTALASQEILRISPNGRIRERLQGGIAGLDQPFDLALATDGRIFVSEFGGDRVTVLEPDGRRGESMGSTGLEPGQLLGPQYLALDRDRDLYVSEWGNRRVSKFATDGTFLLSFGGPTAFFEGLRRPTGIAVDSDGLVYVADADDRGIALQVFDESGNHLRRIEMPLAGSDAAEDSISGAVIEDLGWYDDDHLLVAIGREVLVFNPRSEAIVTRIADGQRRRVSSAARDANGRVIVSDFDADQLGIFEPEGTLYSGLDVRIERIIAREFPQVGVLVNVVDRDGHPILGLADENFVLSENGVPRNDAVVDASGLSVTRLDVSVLMQSRSAPLYREDVSRVVADLSQLLDANDRLQLYRAADRAVEVFRGRATAERWAEETDASLSAGGDPFAADGVRLGASIREAARELVTGDIRRHLVLVGDGRVGDSAFAEYGLEETAGYLAVNGIQLHVVLVEQVTPAAELSYLVEQTGGSVRFAFEPDGLIPLATRMRSNVPGRYWLVFQAGSDPDFGRRYINLSVEARLFVRSGRDELGFYGPAAP